MDLIDLPKNNRKRVCIGNDGRANKLSFFSSLATSRRERYTRFDQCKCERMYMYVCVHIRKSKEENVKKRVQHNR